MRVATVGLSVVSSMDTETPKEPPRHGASLLSVFITSLSAAIVVAGARAKRNQEQKHVEPAHHIEPFMPPAPPGGRSGGGG